MARIPAALPAGTSAVASVLFFDKNNRDKKGFSTGEGAILVGGFYKRYGNYVPYLHRLTHICTHHCVE
jgi:hypothetical protein